MRGDRIINPLGLHARAAARFVHRASAFQSRMRVARRRQEMDGKSIMGLAAAGGGAGHALTISADGVDESDAIAALCGLVERGFDEASCV